MTDVEDVATQVQKHLERWNASPVDNAITYAIGEPVPEGDGRLTAAGRPDAMDHDRNPADSKTDAERMFRDDGDDDDEEVEDYSDEEEWTFQDLKDEIDRRNADRDEENHISKGGGRADLVERLMTDDEDLRVQSEDEDEDDDEDE